MTLMIVAQDNDHALVDEYTIFDFDDDADSEDGILGNLGPHLPIYQ